LKQFYNASKTQLLFSFTGISQVNPYKEATLDSVLVEGRNPTQDKGKRKVSYSPGEE